MRNRTLAALAIAATALTAIALPAGAASKKTTKPIAPAAGKACKAAQVGQQIVGADGVLFDCVKQGAKFVFRVSALNATTTTAAPATTAVGAAAAPATTKKATTWPSKLVFAGVPAENATAQAAAWDPFVKALSKKVGIKIEQISATAYAGVIEGQVSAKVDLAMYGPFSYYLAKQAGAKIDPVGVLVNGIGFPASYQSFLITKADSAINSINDLRGKRVCFVDPASTSGYLYPTEGLLAAGINPDKDIQATFAGGHDKSVIAVRDGKCDAGFAFDDMVNKTAVAAGYIKPGDMKIVWKSKGIPQSPLAVLTSLPDDLVAKIKKSVLELDSLYLQGNGYCPSDKPNCGVGSLDVGSNAPAWIQVTDAFFQPIADVCKATNAKACKPN